MIKRALITLVAVLSIVGLASPAQAQRDKGGTEFTYNEHKDFTSPATARVSVSTDAFWQTDGVGYLFDDITVGMNSNFGCELCVSVDTLKIVALPPSGPVTKWVTHGPNLTHSADFGCGSGGVCSRTWDLSSAGGTVAANTETARVVLIGALWNPNGPHNDFTITVNVCRSPTFGC